MGQLDKQLVIFLCIFGAACVVVIGYAVHRFCVGQKASEDDEEFNQRHNEQDQYMAELREKYREGIMMDLKSVRRPMQYGSPSAQY